MSNFIEPYHSQFSSTRTLAECQTDTALASYHMLKHLCIQSKLRRYHKTVSNKFQTVADRLYEAQKACFAEFVLILQKLCSDVH